MRAGPPRAVRYADQLATAQVSGKRKRNAPALGAGAVLAIVEARGGGGAFEVRAGLPGKLLEVNQRVAADPRLLSERPEADGLAVLQPACLEALRAAQNPSTSVCRRCRTHARPGGPVGASRGGGRAAAPARPAASAALAPAPGGGGARHGEGRDGRRPGRSEPVPAGPRAREPGRLPHFRPRARPVAAADGDVRG